MASSSNPQHATSLFRVANPQGKSDTWRSDFKSFRLDGHVYVDKTLLCKTLFEDGRFKVVPFPPRFGKSLSLSMLEAFFGILYPGQLTE